MAEFTAHPPGTPCWVDLMTPDVEGATAFYTTVFGWEAEAQTDDEGNQIYTLFRVKGKATAGMGASPPDMAATPPVWSTYIAVNDLEGTASSVTAAGGAVIMPPMEVTEAGSMAVFADPAGAAFSVWKAGEHMGAEIGNEPNTYSWNELMSRDVETARAFYSQVFGWAYEEFDMGPAGTYHVIAGGGNNGLGGLMAMPAEVPAEVPSHWVAYFTVADLDTTVATAIGAGGQVLAGPMDIPDVGRSAALTDPAGGAFSVLEPAPEA